VTKLEQESLFWQQLESLSQRLQNGIQLQLRQNCLSMVELERGKRHQENLPERWILLSIIHLLGTVESRGGIRQVLIQLVPESNL